MMVKMRKAEAELSTVKAALDAATAELAALKS
jgi:hypothetical protein